MSATINRTRITDAITVDYAIIFQQNILGGSHGNNGVHAQRLVETGRRLGRGFVTSVSAMSVMFRAEVMLLKQLSVF